MIPALIIINDALLSTGMSQIEIDHLMARFLEEEARNYIEAVDSVLDQKENTVLH